jgi:hypothetical protein
MRSSFLRDSHVSVASGASFALPHHKSNKETGSHLPPAAR